jgi:hypothetical protein
MAVGMRRSTSRIGKLPGEVLEEVNEKLYAGWEYPQVRRWLFEEVAGVDVPALGLVKGEKFAEVWLRAAKTAGNAGHFCELALGTWYRSRHPVWVREKLRRGESMRMVRRAGVLTRSVYAESFDATGSPNRKDVDGTQEAAAENDGAGISVSGGDVIMRSVLIDAISSVEEGGKDRREIAQLANAWARLNAGKMEEEKLKLKTQSKLEMAFNELGKDLRNDPEAKELFDKLYAVAKRLDEQKLAISKSR